MMGSTMPVRRPVIVWPRLVLSAVAATLLFATAASGERLPISVYAAANGLAHDRVKCLVRDSRGFLAGTLTSVDQ
jgi:hypothetical protein